MQIFFTLAYSGIDRNSWSQKKFHEIVTSYIKTLDGVEIEDLKATTGWNVYKCLIPVTDLAHALTMRKHIEKLCKDVNSKCRPYYFRHRNHDEKLEKLSIIGLNYEENQRFLDKAPAGVYRDISV